MPRFCLSEQKTLLHVYGFRYSFSISTTCVYQGPIVCQKKSHVILMTRLTRGGIIPIFQLRKLSLTEVTKFAQDYMVHTEKAMPPHSNTLAWQIPWTEEPGGLQSMGSRRVGHD